MSGVLNFNLQSGQAFSDGCATPRIVSGAGVVWQAPPGPVGPPGPAGGAAINGIAATSINALSAVYSALDGLRVSSANQSATIEVVGVAKNSAAAGAAVVVQVQDELFEPTWNWVVGKPIWLGLNGALTQATPVIGVQIELGIATGAQKILVRIQPPIFLT